MTTSIQVYDPMSAYNSAINKLEKNGIRATKQRRVLAKLIFEKGKRHISAENLFDEVKKEERKIILLQRKMNIWLDFTEEFTVLSKMMVHQFPTILTILPTETEQQDGSM